MGYEFMDSKGEVDVQAPNISGMKLLRETVDAQTKGLYPQLTVFVNDGVSHKPLLLANEAKVLGNKTEDTNVRDMLSSLSQACRKAKVFLALVM